MSLTLNFTRSCTGELTRNFSAPEVKHGHGHSQAVPMPLMPTTRRFLCLRRHFILIFILTGWVPDAVGCSEVQTGDLVEMGVVGDCGAVCGLVGACRLGAGSRCSGRGGGGVDGWAAANGGIVYGLAGAVIAGLHCGGIQEFGSRTIVAVVSLSFVLGGRIHNRLVQTVDSQLVR